MPTNQQLIVAYAIPGAISLVLAVLAWRPWSNGSPRGYWALPTALGVAVAAAVIGFAHQHKLPDWPARPAEDWLFWGAIALVLIGLIDAFVPLWGEIRSVLTVILAGGLMFLVLGQTTNQWPAHRIVTCLGGAAVVTSLASILIERTSEKLPGWPVPLVLLICAAGLAPWPLFLSTPDFTFRAAALPIALLPVVLIAWWSRKFTLGRGGAMVFAVLYGTIVVLTKGRIPDTPAWQAIVLGAAPIVAIALLWLPLRGWKLQVIALALATSMVLTVVIPAYLAWQKQQASPDAYWGG